METLGNTKAPVEISVVLCVQEDERREPRTTLAKWVGTETLGGEPITSYVWIISMKFKQVKKCTLLNSPLSISRQALVLVNKAVLWIQIRRHTTKSVFGTSSLHMPSLWIWLNKCSTLNEINPTMAIESIPNLRRHVAQVESLVHGLLYLLWEHGRVDNVIP